MSGRVSETTMAPRSSGFELELAAETDNVPLVRHALRGLLEASGVAEERREGRMFGEERLAELLRVSAGLSAAGIADRIERAVLEFTPGPPADDVAVIVLRLTGNE